MRLVGSLAVEGETNPGEDVLTFKGGKFSSRTCLEYGFAPAPYWVRRDARGLHFRAELHSREHGIMDFDGIFDGTELLAPCGPKSAGTGRLSRSFGSGAGPRDRRNRDRGSRTEAELGRHRVINEP